MKLLAYVFIVPATLFLMSATSEVLSSGPAPTCQIKTKYTGDLRNDPDWLGGDECEGTCPTSGDCVRRAVDENPLVRTYECQCPSGGGNDGCRGQTIWTRGTVEDPWTIDRLKCVEEGCPENAPTCDWIDRGATGAPGVNWAGCQCQ